jgi:glycosyltransferase involved in cell wall biosynthesis
VIVTCPSPFPAVIVAIYARIFGAPYVLDAHPSAFGHRAKIWQLFVPLLKSLARRACVTMVTEPALGAVVAEWGGTPLVFHEALPPLSPAVCPRTRRVRPTVVFTTIFAPDEPLEAITGATHQLHDCDVAITGDHSRLPQELKADLLAESHVSLTGWLDQPNYLALIANADVVVALTRDPHSVMRSAFEAVYLERPTVLSDTTTLREAFSPSVFVENDAAAIASGVRSVLGEHEKWRERMHERHVILVERSISQQEALEAAIHDAKKRSTSKVHPGVRMTDRAR